MAKPITRRDALIRGQLSRRWGVSAARVIGLIEAGRLPGVFVIPATGKFGKVVKVPMSSVWEAEKKWKITRVRDVTFAEGTWADRQDVVGQADLPHAGTEAVAGLRPAMNSTTPTHRQSVPKGAQGRCSIYLSD